MFDLSSDAYAWKGGERFSSRRHETDWYFRQERFEPRGHTRELGLLAHTAAEQNHSLRAPRGDEVGDIRERFPLHRIAGDEQIDITRAQDLLDVRDEQKSARERDAGDRGVGRAQHAEATHRQPSFDVRSQRTPKEKGRANYRRCPRPFLKPTPWPKPCGASRGPM